MDPFFLSGRSSPKLILSSSSRLTDTAPILLSENIPPRARLGKCPWSVLNPLGGRDHTTRVVVGGIGLYYY
jgi:hypothetical protein